MPKNNDVDDDTDDDDTDTDNDDIRDNTNEAKIFFFFRSNLEFKFFHTLKNLKFRNHRGVPLA